MPELGQYTGSFNFVNFGILMCLFSKHLECILKVDLIPGERHCYRTNVGCLYSSAPLGNKALTSSLGHLGCYHLSPRLMATCPQRHSLLSLNEFLLGVWKMLSWLCVIIGMQHLQMGLEQTALGTPSLLGRKVVFYSLHFFI